VDISVALENVASPPPPHKTQVDISIGLKDVASPPPPHKTQVHISIDLENVASPPPAMQLILAQPILFQVWVRQPIPQHKLTCNKPHKTNTHTHIMTPIVQQIFNQTFYATNPTRQINMK
jgi:hypothetical protein